MVGEMAADHQRRNAIMFGCIREHILRVITFKKIPQLVNRTKKLGGESALHLLARRLCIRLGKPGVRGRGMNMVGDEARGFKAATRAVLSPEDKPHPFLIRKTHGQAQRLSGGRTPIIKQLSLWYCQHVGQRFIRYRAGRQSPGFASGVCQGSANVPWRKIPTANSSAGRAQRRRQVNSSFHSCRAGKVGYSRQRSQRVVAGTRRRNLGHGRVAGFRSQVLEVINKAFGRFARIKTKHGLQLAIRCQVGIGTLGQDLLPQSMKLCLVYFALLKAAENTPNKRVNGIFERASRYPALAV